MIRGLGRKTHGTAVLIFVSLAERYVRIVADEKIAARVPQSEWQAAVDALIPHMRDGRIADGFVVAIERCGAVLAAAFSAAAGRRGRIAGSYLCDLRRLAAGRDAAIRQR